MITLQEIKESLTEFYEDEDLSELGYLSKGIKIGNLLFTTEEQFGGEGQGDDYYIVNKVTRQDGSDETFIYIQGSYTSYDGVDFYDGLDSISIVVPEMVQVRKWKEVTKSSSPPY